MAIKSCYFYDACGWTGRNDEELNKLFSQVTIPGAGVLPNIHTVLLQKKSAATMNAAVAAVAGAAAGESSRSPSKGKKH